MDGSIPGLDQQFRSPRPNRERQCSDDIGSEESDRTSVDNDTMVILELPSQGDALFIGRLVEVGRGYLAFDYVVIEKTLENHLNMPCEVRLKKDLDSVIGPESVPCMVVSDICAPTVSFFNQPIRRCGLRLVEPSSSIPLQELLL